MNPFRTAVDRWLGRGDASIAMPPMDGAFRPNDLLDSAPPIIETPAPDCLAVTSQGVVVSSQTLAVQRRQAGRRAARFLRCGDQRAGWIAGRRRGGRPDRRQNRLRRRRAGRKDNRGQPRNEVHHRAGARPRGNTARRQWLGVERAGRLEARPDGEERLRVCVADRTRQRRTQATGGEIWLIPYGLLEEADSVVVSESWRSALTRISPGASGRGEPVLENLPAYPSRLSRDANNAIWLALFAPRRQLVEFVLREDRYRRRMIDEVDADYWIAPCLARGPDASRADAAGRRHAVRSC